MITPSWLSRTLLVTTALVTPGLAYAQDTGTTLPPQPVEQTAAPADDLAPDSDPVEAQASAPDVSLPGQIVVTGRRTRNVTRTADQVVSVLSTEDIARTGEGDIAGALGRVTGLSVVGSGFVYVRGLGDRYSLALLNGLPLPSPEPLRRVVPLDLFPTNVIASSLVQKSYSANFPGEFGGGVINLTTIAVPDESFLTVGAGVSANSETTGKLGYTYYGSDTDWTGYDDGARNVPAALKDYFASGLRIGDAGVDAAAITGALVKPNLAVVQRNNDIPANFSGSITGGTAFDAGDARVGVVATLSLSNEWNTRDTIQQSASTADLTVLRGDYRSVNTDNKVTVNGLFGVGVEWGEHKLRWTNLYIHDTLKQTRFAEGKDVGSGFDRINQDTAFFERQLFDSQMVAELRFGEFGVDLRGGYAKSKRDAPFETNFSYVRTNNQNDPYGNVYVNLLNNGQNGGASVAFSNLDEDLWYGGADFSYLLAPRLSVTAGYAYTDTHRESARREFLIVAPGDMPNYIGLWRPDQLVRPFTVDNFGISVIESTQATPAFQANLEIQAGYIKANWEPLDSVSLDVGVRYEDAKQSVSPLLVFADSISSDASTSLNNDYWLPAATLTWEVAPDVQLRFNASKTIARPQFRELIFQLYFDPESNRSYRGNPYLVDSELKNAEARIEYYLGSNERVSLAGFYKDIKNPIETFVSFGDNGSRGGFANAPKAMLYGAEFELQKYFDLSGSGGMFSSRRIVAMLNYTYTQSELKVGANDLVSVYPSEPRPATNFFQDGAPLTGQSDHIANLQFGLEDIDSLSQQTILITYASKRVVGRGDGSLPDVIEKPGITVDFVARQGVTLFGIDTEWKFEARNIFNENHEEYQSTADTRIDVNTYDIGRKFSLSASAKF